MRIVSGSHKGRRISPPKNLPVRPTTDMGKESLFNILNNRMELVDARGLDLFSGTGNISYEMGSRGFSDITSVDADSGCIKFIRKTATEFEFPINAVQSNSFTFLDKTNSRYDLIFADPPYAMEQKDFDRLVNTVFERNLLDDDGLLVVEHSKYTKLELLPNYLFGRDYGGTFFSFFGLEEDQD
ncbi:RsmD family RNA methyltransferase [Flavobacterium silvaticum]|uniref:Methyltransferase n=1 Tax=Flavobacterium silvaticum TaxID=1852020 RepID=A0A972FR31_9FLAO|nr:RsmD family RNA methyltransferase [Flavobacterium silvaticum]NMH26933.1 methyltransferase [Flavobacterium silvaticum]